MAEGTKWWRHGGEARDFLEGDAEGVRLVQKPVSLDLRAETLL